MAAGRNIEVDHGGAEYSISLLFPFSAILALIGCILLQMLQQLQKKLQLQLQHRRRPLQVCACFRHDNINGGSKTWTLVTVDQTEPPFLPVRSSNVEQF